MKVLAIIGSPRKGNSYRLTQRVEQTLRSLGNVEFDYLFLADAHLEMCKGCFVCLTRGEERCPLKDDRDEIERRMLDADGVIFVSPVYALNVTALLKNLYDRFAYAMHRPRFFRQRAMLICTTGFWGRRATLGRMAAVRYMGFPVVCSSGIVAPTTTRAQAKAHKAADAAARTLYSALTKARLPRPNLMQVLQFHVQQAIFPLLKSQAPCDYEYFSERGWFDPGRHYYVDASVGPLVRALGNAVAFIVRRRTAREMKEAGS